MGSGNARDGVGRPGTGCHQGHADLAGRPGITVGGMHRPLLVANQNVLDIASIQFIVNIDHGAAGITENGVHIFFLEHVQQNLGSF